MTATSHTVVDSPLGPITLVATDGVLCGLYLDRQRHRPGEAVFGAADGRGLEAVVEQLDAYFAGDLTRFELPTRAVGSPWQQRVWEALADIPYGSTCTYGELAAAVGRPGAARAVGSANGRNPISIVVPCHRVVASGGGLGGYGGGLERKRWLLEHERRGVVTVAAGSVR